MNIFRVETYSNFNQMHAAQILEIQKQILKNYMFL